MSMSPSNGEKTLSFEGRAKRLDSREDAKEFVEAIVNSGEIEVLQLNGNTVGREAADALRDALKLKSTLKRLVWHDIFTGRLREELPPSLKAMNDGVIESGARLIEINLSDNAFGPAGVDGIKDILASPACFTLKELRLNNNGLGTFGAAALAKALKEGYTNSLHQGSQEPFHLEVFIAGRNRLENPGCTDMASVFDMMRSLIQIEIPQNGIQAAGISALASALQYNTNLKILNLNDNIVTEKGAVPLVDGLKALEHLEVLNLGDSIIRNPGALKLAEAAEFSWPKLKTLILSFCEIETSGGVAVANALKKKTTLSLLDLNGNNFGDDGIEEIKTVFFSGNVHEPSVLASFDEDQGLKDDEEERNEHGEGNTELLAEGNTLQEFLKKPSSRLLESFGPKSTEIILNHLSGQLQSVEVVANLFLDISTECDLNDKTLTLLDAILRDSVASYNVSIMRFCDIVLEQCGLIKSETKVEKRTNLSGPLKALAHVVRQDYFSRSGRLVLRTFFDNLEYSSEQSRLMMALYA